MHRDVKPQNVLIDEEGRAKVTDFGIALGLEPEGLTAAGRVVGTTDYVSPEQAMGRDVTGHSDVYSLGIVLFEMLTGEVPFKGESGVSVAMKHVQRGHPRRPAPPPRGVGRARRGARARDLEGARATGTRRWRTSCGDLEEVLTYETARAGEIDGRGDGDPAVRSPPTSPGSARPGGDSLPGRLRADRGRRGSRARRC